MGKSRFFLIILTILIIPAVGWSDDMDSKKVDFLQGNYRRVIFESQSQASLAKAERSDELNYILGLSYLKEAKLEQAQECFKLILAGPSHKFKPQAELGLADTYLVGARFQEAENIYNKLIADESNNMKAAILYRLSQLEFKRGNQQRGDDYLSKLKKDFPLSPELRLTRGLALINKPALTTANTGEFSVQVGFFTSISNATNLKDKLLARNYPAYLENAGSGYRVKVGHLKTSNEALILGNKLSHEGFQTKICP
ncbi:MAG: hypothetical protein COV71_03255 [Candidatus Omnitrophica bacterium CG11_big_fil_rev_8_21_14_0_20_41_12]|nr:MAG: hypothetical protein COV71_03255 [Candidatus Omnitrophica bacterium CG11_big_fil_rev_8_21_14_0_20_41_12]